MSSTPAPLAERLRPESLDQLVGQKHLTGKGSILRTALEQGKMPSMILWGPPGTGKTTHCQYYCAYPACSFLYPERHFLRGKRSAGSDRRGQTKGKSDPFYR